MNGTCRVRVGMSRVSTILLVSQGEQRTLSVGNLQPPAFICTNRFFFFSHSKQYQSLLACNVVGLPRCTTVDRYIQPAPHHLGHFTTHFTTILMFFGYTGISLRRNGKPMTRSPLQALWGSASEEGKRGVPSCAGIFVRRGP